MTTTVMDFQPITPLNLSPAIIVNMPSLSELADKLDTNKIIVEYEKYKTALEKISLPFGTTYKFKDIPTLTHDYCRNHSQECKANPATNLKYDIDIFINLLSKELLNYIRSLEDRTYVVFKSLKSSGILIFQKKYCKKM